MTTVQVQCPAKTNLTLHVGARHEEWDSTSAESTFGAGQNTLRPIAPTVCAVPYHASLTLGVP